MKKTSKQSNFQFLKRNLLLLCFTLVITIPEGFTQQDIEDVKTTNPHIADMLKKVDFGIDVVTNYSGKMEYWSVDSLDDNTRAYYIFSYEKEVLYAELFIEKKEKLDFAVEWEKMMPLNQSPLQTWQCVYYFKNGKLIDYRSLGHGKTEDDAWEPEEIHTEFSKRKAEFEIIQK